MNFETILKYTQKDLFNKLKRKFDNCIYSKDNYIFVEGATPIMLVAHLDTVHKEPVKTIYTINNILTSPQGIGGDDRCGVYALLEIYKRSKLKPSLLFTCNEEIGGLGANQFCEDWLNNKVLFDLPKMIIEIDLSGYKEATFYDCQNYDFMDFILSKGFMYRQGVFSDISIIAPYLNVAAVNLSAGYYNAHTLKEVININHLEYTIKKVIKLVNNSNKFMYYDYGYTSEYLHNNF